MNYKKIIYPLFCVLLSLPAMAADAWKGQFISYEIDQSEPNTWCIFRKDVKLVSVPKSLMARIAVDSKYWLWINDRLVVFEGGLKRGPERNATYYDEVDIAPYLVVGDNTIAIQTWFFGKNGFSHASSGLSCLLFEAVGDGVEIISDISWRGNVYRAYKNTEAPFPNFRLPESNICFDARMEIIDWNKKSFVGELFTPSHCVAAKDAPIGKLVKRPIPQWKNYGLKPYENTRKSGDTLICRLPYDCHITPYFKIRAKSGATIRMQMDNYMIGGTPNVRAEYITRDGEQEYESFGWMNGHEVWYVFPEGVEVLDVKYRETGYDAEFVKPFLCNDEFYNELWKRAERTLYVTMRDTYMDCPDRERSQWWGDEVNELGESFYGLTPSAQKLALKGIYELMNWQREDGVIFAPCPAGNWNKELPMQMLASVSWYGFYTQYFYSGDSTFVPIIYDRLHRYLHDVWKTDADGFVIERQGDWYWGDWGENRDMATLVNCWYYLALKAEKAFAGQLGKTSDVETIEQMMMRIEQNFDKRFWTGSAYRSSEYTGETDDRVQAMAVVSGLAKKDKYQALLKVLKKEYHASPYMEKYVLEALFKMNQPEFALQRMKERYGVMLKYKDYTTLFEGWGVVGGTVNHGWSGGPLTLLSQKVCGIEPVLPGFRAFRVCPQMGMLTEASASVASVSGTINVSIIRHGSVLKVSVDVPEGTSAEIVFPSGKKIKLESGSHTVESK